MEDVLVAQNGHVPAPEVRHVAALGDAGRVCAPHRVEQEKSVAHQPDVRQPGLLRGVLVVAVRPVERGQVRDAQGHAGVVHVGADRRVRRRSRGREDQAAHAAGPATILQEHVERLRHVQPRAVHRLVLVLVHGRIPNDLCRRGFGPKVLALGRPAANRRGAVRRSHRHGVHTIVVPVSTELLYRTYAGTYYETSTVRCTINLGFEIFQMRCFILK